MQMDVCLEATYTTWGYSSAMSIHLSAREMLYQTQTDINTTLN